MMMVALAPDAERHLSEYLKQVKAALGGRSSVDAAEVERDVLGHIDAELSGEAQPIPAHRLLAVLDRLGAPDEWMPAEHGSRSRPSVASPSQPRYWGPALLSFGSLTLAFVFMLGSVMLWPLPLVLTAIGFVTARVTIGLIENAGEPIGLRRWLIYPALLVVYIPLVFALVGGPALVIADFLAQDAAARAQLATFAGASPWLAVPGAIALILGCWWAVLGLLSIQFMTGIGSVFRPFVGRIERRHAARLAIAGLAIALIGIATLTIPRLM